MFSEKSLLITGGTGSFGHAVVRQLLSSDIREIRIFSRDEKKQDDMRREYGSAKLKFYIGDVRSPASLQDAMEGADFVFHAAALKQVPSCEFYPMEAVRTNINGTDNVLTTAIRAGVGRVVALSTDKAAYPVNAMGMTKGIMEKLVMARARVAAENGCILSVTRYGNVIASRGSVIPLFVDQVLRGEPLTVTDPKMTRFMMTLQDAVDLVVHAFQNAAPGQLFVHKAPAASIITLAEAVRSVFQAENPIQVIGTRHGEKRYETLLTREEMNRAADQGRYYCVEADTRDLNYEQFFSVGESRLADLEDYHSHMVRRLSHDELVDLLLDEPHIQEALGNSSRRRFDGTEESEGRSGI